LIEVARAVHVAVETRHMDFDTDYFASDYSFAVAALEFLADFVVAAFASALAAVFRVRVAGMP